MTVIPRRAALGLLVSAAAGAALSLGRLSPAAAQGLAPTPFGDSVGLPAGLRFRDVVVDASRLARLGNEAGAALVTQVMTRQLQEVFADLMAPRSAAGATLVAKISSIYLGSYTGSRAYNGKSGGGGDDNLEGVGIVSSGGRVLAQVPILSVLTPSYSGAWYQPNIDELRTVSICHHFAWWLRREMGV
ncbi:MAG: hypothetical protein ACRYGP_14415 [Janthinobacterium lividum]